jgi:superfamily II DNA or RNA helicase
VHTHDVVAPLSRVTPVPLVLLRVEHVTIDRSGGYGSMLETVPVPVIELRFDYGGQPICASDPRDQVLQSTPHGMRAVARDYEAEGQARRALESFGAVELACLEDYALAPDSRAHYLLRCDGDVHDYCTFGASVVPQLAARGWTVEIDRAYPYRIADADGSSFYANVSRDRDRPDWFALELGVELDGRRVNLLPALVDLLEGTSERSSLASLARRERCVALPLPDGRYLPIPPERIQALLRVLSELYSSGSFELDTIHFSEIHAPALSRLTEIFARGKRPLRWEGQCELEGSGETLRSSAPPPLETPAELRATLRSYQRAGVEWLQHLRACGVGGILADDMGLGKTLQTIAHLVVEKAAGRLVRPALVVAPTSLISVWDREIGKFAPHLKTVVIHGPRRADRFDHIASSDVVITSYPILVRDEERLAAHEYHLLILDEAHTIKNTRSLAHQAAKRVTAAHRLCLTGTPIENHLGELWALFDFLNPGLLGDELAFKRWYRVPIEDQGDEDRLIALRETLSPYLMRRLKREVATELPPKTERERPVILTGAQRELYESIRICAHGEVRKLIAKKGLAASTVPILDALTKLRQVCCDPRLVPMRAARDVARSAKYELLFELLEAQLGRGHRVLVFSQFTRMLALISRGLDQRATKHLILTGESKDRASLVDSFERGDADVFLISLKAGGVGLTLTSADTVIHYDPWWNPAAQDQATDRAYRIGQTKPVVAYNLVAQGSVEERMRELQQRKRRLADGILSGASARFALDEDDVEELFAPLGA